MKLTSYFDIHTHLNFSSFDADRKAVYERARAASVAMINVGTQQDTSRTAVEFAKTHDGAYATIGLHPIHTDKSYHDVEELGEGGKEFTSRGEEFDYEYYKILGADPKVVAIGECGLDYFRITRNEARIKQEENFRKQIELARELKKPLMLHIRNAYKEAINILKQYPDVKGNSHFFAGDWNEAKMFLDLGHTLSFTGVVTFARNYDEVIKNAPLDMIMSETDAPYVAPTLYRGQRNEPAYVVEVVKKIAEIRGEDFGKVRDQLATNAKRVFGLGV